VRIETVSHHGQEEEPTRAAEFSGAEAGEPGVPPARGEGQEGPRELPPTHYVVSNGVSIFVKEANFFRSQGGLTEPWGRRWRPVHASSIEHARQIGDSMWPSYTEDEITRRKVAYYVRGESPAEGTMYDSRRS